jgi:C1A family cysteine protease
MKRVWQLKLLLVLVILVAAVILAATMNERAHAAQLQTRMSALLPGFTEMPIQVNAQLATRLRNTKQQANLQLLRNSYIMRNNKPFFRAADGREFSLVPLTRDNYQPTMAEINKSQVLPAQMLKYNNLIVKGVDPSIVMASFVDHRSKQTPIKDQDHRGTCVCFASMAGMEAKYGGGTLDLSEQYANYLFMKAEGRVCKDDGIYTHMSADYLSANGIGKESDCPYLTDSFAPYCNNNGGAPQRTNIAAHADYKITGFGKIWRDETVSDAGAYINNPIYLETLLREGYDIVFGTHVAGWTGNCTGVLDVKLDPNGNPLPSDGGHAMLIVGYNRPEQYFIVKNSWGTAKGQSGYFYLSYDYIRTYAKYGYIITSVKPVIMQMRSNLRPLIIK